MVPMTPKLPRGCTFSESDWRALAAFWHPVALADQVGTAKPLAVVLLDVELVLYRAGGTVVAARDLCLHRGVPLSLGWIETEEIVCAYHGFRYGANGECTSVPAQPHAAIPRKLCLTTYPVIERYNLIWVCLAGDGTRPLPEWPELEDPNQRTLQVDCGVWQCSAARHTENFNDLAHLSWVHAGTFGNRERPEVAAYDVEVRPGGLHFESDYERYSLGIETGAKSIETIRYVYDHSLPFYSRLQIRFENGGVLTIFDLASPQSARKSHIFLRSSRTFDLEGPNEPHTAALLKVLDEDKAIVEAQRPEELPLDLSEEFHIRADRFSTVYRQQLRASGLGVEYTS